MFVTKSYSYVFSITQAVASIERTDYFGPSETPVSVVIDRDSTSNGASISAREKKDRLVTPREAHSHLLVPHEAVEENGVEGQLAGELLAHHQHPCHPEEKNVVPGLHHLHNGRRRHSYS